MEVTRTARSHILAETSKFPDMIDGNFRDIDLRFSTFLAKVINNHSFLRPFLFFDRYVGAFGQVWRCEANDIDGVEGISTVAVKTLKENAIESEKTDLASELQVMKSLEPHVRSIESFLVLSLVNLPFASR